MRRLKSQNPQKEVINTISYFGLFSYAPDFEQIFTFFPQKITRKALKTLLEDLVKSKKLSKTDINIKKDALLHQNKLNIKIHNSESVAVYTLPQYSIFCKNRALRSEVTALKLRNVRAYFTMLSGIPFIRYAGISGSAAVGNCRKTDDVDLCIITSRNLLFTGRFLAILLAGLLGLRDPKNGVCLNLFFDEDDLVIPDRKKTPYVAHELIQMRTVFDKNKIYARFLSANRWLRAFFPNVSLPRQGFRTPKRGLASYFLLPVEFLLRFIQLAVIRKNKTGHFISPTQLWLFRRDYEHRFSEASHLL